MKRYITYLLALALVSPAIVSCTEQLQNEGEVQKHSVYFSTRELATRTGLVIEDNMVIPNWNKTTLTNVHLFELGANGQTGLGETRSMDVSDDQLTAHFKADFPAGQSAPFKYAAVIASNPGGALSFVIPSEQHPDSATLKDPDADFLVGYSRKSYAEQSASDEYVVDLYFTRVAALGRFSISNFKGSGEKVKSVTIHAENGLVGSASYPDDIDFDNSSVRFVRDEGPGILTLSYGKGINVPDDGTFYAYFVTIPGAVTLTSIEVETDQFCYVRDIAGGKEYTFSNESFKDINLDLGNASAEEVGPAPTEYVKVSSLTVGASYIIVDVDDQRVFTGAKAGSYEAVSPVDGVITSEALAAYEFTVEQSGNNYYLKFNDGNYLVSDYGSSGDSESGLRYVATQSAVTYPYALTIANGAFMFSTTQMSSTSSTNQVLYYKPASAGGTGPDRFKIGGSGASIGIHLYEKNGKQDRGLQFEPESITCLQGSTPERPELLGIFSTLKWSSDNTAVATVDGSGNVTVVGPGIAIITAEAEEDDTYKAGTASYTLTVLDPSTAVYVKTSSLTVGASYIIVDVDDQRVFTGAKAGSYESVSPVNDIITDTNRKLVAYEFTVEQSGSNYYLKFNDGNYLVSDYGSSGDSESGLRYVATQSAVTYPYALTIANGAFMFSTTQMSSTSSTNQVLYYKPASAGGTGPDRFKIGGSGASIGVHLYQKGGKRDRGLTFDSESVTCFLGSTPEKPELSGVFTTLTWTSDNTAVATVDGNGNVSVKGVGFAKITASAGEDDDYIAGSASYTLTVLDPNGSSYTKVSSLTVGGTYLIVDVDDQRVFTGAKAGSYESVSPVNNIITDTNRKLVAYEFTVEQSGSNYYLKFNDGNYLVSDYGSSGDSESGLRYVATQSAVTYPYALTIANGAFMFSTTQMSSTSSTNQVLYYKPASAGGTGPDRFKIGGSGASIGVHLYLKGGGSSGGDTTTKQTQTIGFSASTVTWTLGQNYVIGQSYALPQTASGAQTEVTYTSETPSVATINNGRITIVAAGQATIKATAVESDTFYGATATYTLNIATPAPEGWQHLGPFDLENAALKAYLNEANDTYTDNNEQSVTCVSRIASQYSSITRQDCPAPVTITWTTPASSNTVVTIYSDQGLNTTVLSPVEAAANATSAEVYNLVPGRTYYYTVSENGSIWEKGDFSTTGRRRMLKISDTKAEGHANNCRDLGGMITKDGTKRIKYGYLFRGSNMDRTSANEKSILYNDLKIRMDIDLRSGSAGSSGWGESGNNAAFNAFANANDGNSYSGFGYLNRGFSSFDDLKGSPDRVKDVMNSVMNTVLNGEALYFHCYVGADRTGFFGLLIEGLLGISEADCSMDYELTSFSVVGLRGRDGSGQDHYWGSRNSEKGLALLRSQTGSTFEQKCTNYLLGIGVTQTLINQFKNFILENNN